MYNYQIQNAPKTETFFLRLVQINLLAKLDLSEYL